MFTTNNFQSSFNGHTFLFPSGVVEAQLDYAFDTTWELALTAALQFRPAVNKQDFSFGVSLQYNLCAARKDDSTKPSTPLPAHASAQ
jgi:hypothetical protein